MSWFRAVWMGVMLAGLMGAVAPQPALAHHSFPATYLVDQIITIDGTVSQFLFRNPHSFVHVMTTDKAVAYALDRASLRRLEVGRHVWLIYNTQRRAEVCFSDSAVCGQMIKSKRGWG